ncbi:MAG: ATP-binding protein [Bacillota bacterium]
MIVLRLATKINLFSALIFSVLMGMVTFLTQRHLAGIFRDEMRRSLTITAQGFQLALENLCADQTAKARMQSQRDVLRFSTKEHFNPVLNYYLHLSQADLNVDLLEIIDARGRLLADGTRYYEEEPEVLPYPEEVLAEGRSFLARRGGTLYLISAVPLDYLGERVGYVGVGKRLDRTFLLYLASMLHSEIAFFIDGKYVAGTLPSFPRTHTKRLSGLAPGSSFYISGLPSAGSSYDFVFTSFETGGLFTAVAGIGLNRKNMETTLARLRLFILVVFLFGLSLAWGGSYFLARNIKRSIYGMEPHEIASVLNERNAILQSTFEGIIAVNKEGYITLVNEGARKLLPKGSEAIGRKIAEVLPDPDIGRVLANGEAVYNHQHLLGETIVFYNVVPIKIHHGVIGAVITMRDLTEFQKVAAELVELKTYTQALRAQAHEFINKLHTVSGLIQMGHYDRALAQLHETAQTHQDLISFLLSAIRSANVSGILLGKFNRANELNIRFNLSRASRLERISAIPETELVCIIGNFIENALEALKDYNREEKQVWVKIKERRNYLSILVVDNGPGIPPSIRPLIFERGFTTKAGTNKGLGLALIKQCTTNLRGSISFRSGRLTVFLVRIPFPKGEESHAAHQGPDRRG